MKDYYCREIRGDGEECGETRKEKFYEGRKSVCKYCESKKSYQREKKKREEESSESDPQELLNKIGESVENKFKLYDRAYDITKDKINEMSNEIEELQKLTKELKSQNRELVKLNDLYKNRIKALEGITELFEKEAIKSEKRLRYIEYKFGIRDEF